MDVSKQMYKTFTSSQVIKLYMNIYIRPILQYTLQNKEISYPGTHLIMESDIEYISDRTTRN